MMRFDLSKTETLIICPTIFILGDPGEVSWDDTMFVVKVYC